MTDRMRQTLGLTLAFLPGTVFILGLGYLKQQNRIPWSFSTIPWELWVIALTGTAALVAALCDWYFHTQTAKGKVSALEEQGEVVALLGGGILFTLMASASLANNPRSFLVPILCVLLFTVAMICHDEFVFHRRRCGAYENFLHKVIVFGNGGAWLAWFHWIYVRARLPF